LVNDLSQISYYYLKCVIHCIETLDIWFMLMVLFSKENLFVDLFYPIPVTFYCILFFPVRLSHMNYVLSILRSLVTASNEQVHLNTTETLSRVYTILWIIISRLTETFGVIH
jgi:hypothetical protein